MCAANDEYGCSLSEKGENGAKDGVLEIIPVLR